MAQFSWKRIGKVVAVIILAAAIIIGAYFFITSKPVKAAWASIIHNRRETYTDCQHLPFYPQIQKAAGQHSDILAKVLALPGVTGFSPEKNPCFIESGGPQFIKGEMLLTYNSRAARSAAEKIIGSDFFGIPYRGQPLK